ncbi:IPT/TIG domain-containing protein [Pseudobacteroides cellulosolvens]|uniref:Fibronectin type III domain protein n=1 Tax=Pseudobacteroides cellulosolvens ATCC 35603 = DSM 2933 TaxID=398512 RepID=A0A0L6JUN8_9FIRM|nr:IPT/TIG domain-containing protein [Pseudobacteroides cellulosolvens]KNY29571.1 Fibronectin type III domain protein [Pseudobacteroides cellulosolvens ATCC 35603 = DSM 2933]
MRKILTGLMLCIMLSLCFGVCNTAFAADDISICVYSMGTEISVTDGSYVKGALYAKIKGDPIDFKSIGIRTYKTSGSAPAFIGINLSNSQSGGYIQKALFDFEPGEDKYTSEIKVTYSSNTVKTYKISFNYTGKIPEVSIKPSGYINSSDNATLYIGKNTIRKSINYIDVTHELIESSVPTSKVIKSYNDGNAKRFYPETFNMSEPLEEGYHKFTVAVKYSYTQIKTFTHVIKVDRTVPAINVKSDELDMFRKNGDRFRFDVLEVGACKSGIRDANIVYSLRNESGEITKWETAKMAGMPDRDTVNNCYVKIPFYTEPITVSGDGIKTIAVYVVDNAGNSATQDFQIKFDATKPSIDKSEFYNVSDDTLVDIKSDDGVYLSLSDKIKLRVTGTDNLSGLGKLYLIRSDSNSANPAPTQEQIIEAVKKSDPNAGVVEFEGSDTADLEVSTLSKGKSYDIYYFAADNANNYSDMQKMSVVFDTDAPETPIVTSLSHPEAASKVNGALIPKSDMAGNKQQFEFKVTIPDSQNMNSVSSIEYSISKYSLNSGVSTEFLESGKITTVKSGSSYERVYTKISDVIFEDNDKAEFYKVQVQTKSKNGLLSSPAIFYFRVDTRAPFMEWNETNLGKWISSGNSGIGWTITENTGNPNYKYFISSSQLSEDDVKVKEGQFDTLSNVTPLSVRGQIFLPSSIMLPGGTNYLYVFAKDNAGNVGSIGRVVNVDSEEPTFNGTEDLTLTLHPETNSVDLSWDVMDPVSGIDLINYRIAPVDQWKTAGNEWKYINNLYPAPSSHQGTYTIKGLDPTKEYKVQLEVRDMAGNSAYTSVVSFAMSGITGRQRVVKVNQNIKGVQITGRYNESTEEAILSTFKIVSMPSDLSLVGSMEIEDVSIEMLGGVVQSINMDININGGAKIGEFTFNCGDTSKMILDYDISSNPNGSIKFENISLVLPFGPQEDGLSLPEVTVGLSADGKIYPVFNSTDTVNINFPYDAGGVSFEGLSCNESGLKAGRTTISISDKTYTVNDGVLINSDGTLKPATGNTFFETDNFMDFSLGEAAYFSVNGIKINDESIEVNIDTTILDVLFVRGILEYRFSSGVLYDYCVYLNTINGAQFYAGLKEVAEISFEELAISKDDFDVNGGRFKLGQKFPITRMANDQYNFDASFSKDFFDVIDAIKKFKVYGTSGIKGMDVSGKTLICGMKFTQGTIMNFEKIDGRIMFEVSGGIVLPESLGGRATENIKFSIDDEGNISFYAYDIDVTGVGIGSFKLKAEKPEVAGGKALANIAYVDGKISVQLYNAVLDVNLQGKSIKFKLADLSINENGGIEEFTLSTTNQNITVSDMLRVDIGSITISYSNGGFSIGATDVQAAITGLGKYTVNNLSFDDSGNVNDFSITVPFKSSLTKSNDYEFNGNLTISYIKSGKTIKATIAGNNGQPATFTLKSTSVSRLKSLEGVTFNINEFEMINGKIVKCDMSLPNSKQINLFGDVVTGSINSLSFSNTGDSVLLGFGGYIKVNADNNSITVNLKLNYYPDIPKVEIDASYSGNLEFKIGGFKLKVSDLSITTNKVEFKEAELILPEGLGSLTLKDCYIGLNGKIELGGAALKINKDIVYDVAGCELLLRNPSLAITTLDEIVLRFEKVKLTVFKSAGVEVGGLTLHSTGDFEFDKAKIGLPSFKIGGLGLKDLFVSFGKDVDGNKSYRYFGGGGSVAIPGLGEVGCTLIVQKRPGNFFGDNIKEASFKLELEHGIPLGNTGLEMHYLSGGLYRGTMPDEFPKEYKGMFAGDWKLMSLGIGVQDASGGKLLEAKAHIFVELKDFEWAFKGNGSVLSGVIDGEVRAAYANKIFAAGATVNMTFAEGKVDFYVFSLKGKTQVSGEGKCTIRVNKGAWYGGYKKWGVTILPAIPPWNLSLGSVGVDFGLFKNGKKGVQGWIDVKLLGSISAFVGTGGLVLDSDYKIYNPIKERGTAARSGSFNAVAMLGTMAMADTAYAGGSILYAEGADRNYSFETQTDSIGRPVSIYKFNAEGERILFGMTFEEVLPDMQVIAPDGSILEFGNDNIEYYVENNELIMAVTNLDSYGAGEWKIRASGISREEVFIACKNYVPEINVGNISVDMTTNKASVNGTVTNMKDGSTLKLVFQSKDGSYEKEVDVPLTASTFDSIVNLPSLPDGQYDVFVRLEWEGSNGNPVYLSTDPYPGLIVSIDNKSKSMEHVKELSVSPFAYYRYDSDKNGYAVDESGNKIKGYGLAVEFEDDNEALNDGYMLHIEHLGDAGEVISEEKQNLGALKSINLKGFKKRFVYTPQLDASGNPVLDASGNPVIDVTQVPDKLKVYVKPYRIDKTAVDENDRYQEIGSTGSLLVKYVVIGEDLPVTTTVTSVDIQNAPSEIALEVGGTFPKAESDVIKLTAYATGDMVRAEVIGVPKVTLVQDGKSTNVPVITAILDKTNAKVASGEAVFGLRLVADENALKMSSEEFGKVHDIKIRLSDAANVEGYKEVILKVRLTIPTLSINSILPLSINNMTGGNIDINGTGFIEGTKVYLVNQSGTSTELTDINKSAEEFIKCNVPAGLAGGKYNIKVKTTVSEATYGEQLDIVKPMVGIIDYKLSGHANPSSTASFYFGVKSLDGYTGKASFTFGTLPQGLSLSLDKASYEMNALAKITATLTSQIAQGVHQIKIMWKGIEVGMLKITVTNNAITPYISYISPGTVGVGDSITVYGEGLGGSPTASILTSRNNTNVSLAVTSYGSSMLKAAISSSASTGALSVKNNGVESNTKTINVIGKALRIVPKKTSIILYPGETAYMPFEVKGAGSGLELTSSSDSINVDTGIIAGTDKKLRISVSPDAPRRTVVAYITASESGFSVMEEIKVLIADPSQSTDEYTRGVDTNGRSVSLWFKPNNVTIQGNVSLLYSIRGGTENTVQMIQNNGRWEFKIGMLTNESIISYRFKYTVSNAETTTDKFEYRVSYKDADDDSTIFDLDLTDNGGSGPVSLCLIPKNGFVPSSVKAMFRLAQLLKQLI